MSCLRSLLAASRRFLPVIASISSLAFLIGCQSRPPAPPSASGRELELELRVELPFELDPAAGPVRVWVPMPVEDGRQEVTNVERPSQAVSSDPDPHGNRYSSLALEPFEVELVSDVEEGEGGEAPPTRVELRFGEERSFVWRYRIVRGVDHGGEDTGPREMEWDAIRELYLDADRLVPVTGLPARMAQAKAGELEDPFAVAWMLYLHVLDDVDWGMHDDGYGRGDTLWVMDQHFGNSLDFSAYFTALMRARGIPTRFQIGYRVPPRRAAGVLVEPHAWVHFYVQEHGWIPLDIALADQEPERAVFYFGHLDADRFTLSCGRDLQLDPPMAGEPLNFMARAYAQQGGRELEVRTTISYSDLAED